MFSSLVSLWNPVMPDHDKVKINGSHLIELILKKSIQFTNSYESVIKETWALTETDYRSLKISCAKDHFKNGKIIIFIISLQLRFSKCAPRSSRLLRKVRRAPRNFSQYCATKKYRGRLNAGDDMKLQFSPLTRSKLIAHSIIFNHYNLLFLTCF